MTMEGESSNQHITQAENPPISFLGRNYERCFGRSLWEHEDEEHERLLALIAAFFSTQDSWFHQPNAESCHAAMGCLLRGIASAHN